ncbi:MAG: hypothetical protein ACM3SY_18155 [Candidatus Omnitrophota bacterium]
MTIQEIEEKLPNGFHDAEIEDINLNFVNKLARIDLNIWIGDIKDPEKYQKARLYFTDFLFLSIEPPYEKTYFLNTLTVDLESNDDDILDKYESFKVLKKFLPEGYLITCFVLLNHDTLMYFVAKDVKFEWIQ